MLLVILTKILTGIVYILASSTAVKFAEMSKQRTEPLPYPIPTKNHHYSLHAFNTRGKYVAALSWGNSKEREV